MACVMFDNNVIWQNKLMMFNQHQKDETCHKELLLDIESLVYIFQKDIHLSLLNFVKV